MNTWIEGPPPREKRGMGCVGKGCLILACFIVFLIIAGAIGLYFGMRTHSAVLRSVVWAKKTHDLSQEPTPVAEFETADENMSAARQIWKDFENTRNQPAHIDPSADDRTRNEPAHIELSADDLNNLIARNRHARDKAFVTIEGNRLRIQISDTLGEYTRRGRHNLNADLVTTPEGPHASDHHRPRLSTL